MYLWATVLPGPYCTFHKFGITGQYLSQYICLLDNTREHLRDPIFKAYPPPPPDHPRATLAASRTGLRPVIVQPQTINILRTTSKIQATPLQGTFEPITPALIPYRVNTLHLLIIVSVVYCHCCLILYSHTVIYHLS